MARCQGFQLRPSRSDLTKVSYVLEIPLVVKETLAVPLQAGCQTGTGSEDRWFSTFPQSGVGGRICHLDRPGIYLGPGSGDELSRRFGRGNTGGFSG